MHQKSHPNLSKHLVAHFHEMESHSGSRPFDAAARRFQVSSPFKAWESHVKSVTFRYFDIRLEAVDENGERDWRVLHCLMGARLRGLLLQVRQFLDDHPGEVLILDIQHTYSFLKSDHAALVSFLLSTFNHLLVPYKNTTMPSLGALQNKNNRVVVIYPPAAPCNASFWPRKGCPTPWPETTDTGKLR